MIVKMKKITVMARAKYRNDTLVKLRKLGVLHINFAVNPTSEDIRFLESQVENLDKALLIIRETEAPQEDAGERPAAEIVNQILSLDQEKENLSRELQELQEKRHWFQEWGAVSYASLQNLKESGITVRFYIADKNAYKKLPPGKMIHFVKEERNMVYFAFITESPDERLGFKEIPMPEIEPAMLDSAISRLEEQIAMIDNALKDLSGYRTKLLTERIDLMKEIEFNKVKHTMGMEEQIAYLQGYCPVDSVAKIEEAARLEGWAYTIQDPRDPHEVPTLIRSPKWLRIIDPLFKFMGTLPGYDEQDISFWFLLFFSIFFALIVGDAGYGLIFLLLTLIAAKKFKNVPREQLMLMYVLSGATIFWGLISGNWFGYEKIGKLPFLNLFIINQVDSFIEANQAFMMYLSFIIGIVHLSIARLLSALKRINSPTALAEIGWIAILWTLFFAAGKLVLEKPFPAIMPYVFIAGFLLVLLFANFQKNIFKGIILSLSNLPLEVISSFSDVVSYLRLFAVGYATVTVASSFNGMALEFGFHSALSGLIAASLLFLGHTLNIILALMSVVVHGIRLNMLEFSGHIGMQWSGKAYQPFKE